VIEDEKNVMFVKTNTNTKTIDSRTIIPKCLLEDGYPTPVVLMSLGRSGTHITWQTLNTLTGYDTDRYTEDYMNNKFEYLGMNSNPIKQFFHDQNQKQNDRNGQWLTKYMCELRTKKFPKATFVGISWKSFLDPFQLKESLSTLQQIVSMTDVLQEASSSTSTSSLGSSTTIERRGPPIRIIRSRRNPIDVMLSQYKNGYDCGSDTVIKNNINKPLQILNSHCKKGETLCLNKHYEQGEELIIGDVDLFYSLTYKLWNDENKVDTTLIEMNVPVIFVSYDTMYYPTTPLDGEKEWNKALQYIRGDNYNDSNDSNGNEYKSWQDIQNAMGFESTTRSRNHIDLISNWLEVQQKFVDTPLEKFLRLD